MKINFNSRVLKFVLAGLIFLLGLYFLFLVRGIFLPFIFAVILAYILNPIVVIIEQYLNVSRLIAILMIYAAGLILVLLLFFYGIPLITQELNTLADMIPVLMVEIQGYAQKLYNNFQGIAVSDGIRQVIDEGIRNVEEIIIRGIRQLINAILSIFSGILSIVLAPIMAFYLLKDWQVLGEKIQLIFPVQIREEVISLWSEIDRVLLGFIKGHLIVAAFVGIMTALGLTLIGMDYVLLLSIIAGIGEIIPYFGPIIGSIPTLILALLKSKLTALYVLILIIIIQQIENNVLSPTILGESVGLHPIVVIFALLAGGKIFGLVGMLLAVPTAAVLRIIFIYVFSKLTA
ncbi:MAG: AI-2E family transporter [Clostridia bacterium]|nr:AI-2E family transporter [Clostridia bacterium]